MPSLTGVKLAAIRDAAIAELFVKYIQSLMANYAVTNDQVCNGAFDHMGPPLEPQTAD